MSELDVELPDISRESAALDAILGWLDAIEEADPSSAGHLNVSAGGVASLIREGTGGAECSC